MVWLSQPLWPNLNCESEIKVSLFIQKRIAERDRRSKLNKTKENNILQYTLDHQHSIKCGCSPVCRGADSGERTSHAFAHGVTLAGSSESREMGWTACFPYLSR